MAALTGHGTKTFIDEDFLVSIFPPGTEPDEETIRKMSPLEGVTGVTIRLATNEVVTAEIEVFPTLVSSVSGVFPVFKMFGKTIKKIEFIDGTEFDSAKLFEEMVESKGVKEVRKPWLE